MNTSDIAWQEIPYDSECYLQHDESCECGLITRCELNVTLYDTSRYAGREILFDYSPGSSGYPPATITNPDLTYFRDSRDSLHIVPTRWVIGTN